MTPPDRPHLDVTWDSLQEPDVQARVDQLRSAGAPQLVRPVGSPMTRGAGVLRNNLVALGVAGLVGGLAGWALSELMTNMRADEAAGTDVSHWYGSSLMAAAVVFAGFIALGIGGVLASWDGVEARSWTKAWRRLRVALPILAVGGAIGGALAQKLYENRMEAAVADAFSYADDTGDYSGALDQLESAVHLARGFGFALLGVTIGLALGATSRSKKRAINAALGGAVGGAIGGYMFDYIHIGGSGVMSRLIAITICGLCMGVAVGLVEQVRKDNWLEIATGGMAGKQFILYNDITTLGSGPHCDITLIKDPQIVLQHLVLQRAGTTMRAQAATPGVPFLVNGQEVLEAVLADGDTVQLGSTVLRLREKSAAAPVPGPILG